MKGKLKKVIALVLSCAMILSTSMTAFAAEEDDSTELEAGTYTVSVSASDYVSAMSVEFGGVVEETASVVVGEDGSVQMTLYFTDILIFGSFTGWVSEYYDDSAAVVYGTITAQDGNEYTSVESVTITLSGIADTYSLSYYLQSTMMSFDRSVELTVDWNTLTAASTDDNTDDDSTATYSYTGTATVDGYDYNITVVVYVTDGVITDVDITSDDIEDGTHASYSIYCFEQVAAALDESLVGLSATSADEINGVDAVSGATMTYEAVIEATLAALGLTSDNEASVDLEAGKSYTVDITYKAAAHSLVSNPTATSDDDTDTVSAAITVDENGQAYITIDIYNSEDMYITSYNGLHLGGTTDGTISTDDAEVVEEESDAVTGGSIVTQVTIPLDGYYNEYYTSVSVYVPSMSNVDMDGDGEADGGYFTVDPSTLSIDWSTLTEIAEEVSNEYSYTLYYKHADSTSSYSRYFGHFTEDGTYESGIVEVVQGEDGIYTLTVVVDATSSMLSDVAMILDGYTYTETTDDAGYITYEIIIDDITATIDFQFTYTIAVAGRTNTHDFQIVLEGGTWSGHDYEEVAVDDNNVATYTCSVCGDTYDEYPFTTYYKCEATTRFETYFGNTAKVVDNEDGTYDVTIVIDATNSMLSDVAAIFDGYTYTETADDEGYITYVITVDDLTATINFEFTYTIVAMSMTHTYPFQIVLAGGTWSGHELEYVAEADATCTEDGSNGYFVCSTCGSYFDISYSITVDSIEDPIEISMTVGSPMNLAVSAYISTDGETVSFVQADGSASMMASYIESSAVTANEDGTYTITFSLTDTGNSMIEEISCDQVLTEISEDDAIIVATGHNWSSVAVSAGSYGSTKETYTCSLCGKEKTVTSLYGENRYETAEDIVSNAFESSTYAVIADGSNFPDALAAASLAGALDAPILITSDSEIQDTLEELKSLGVTNVYIVGGTSSVSADVESAIAGEGIEVVRVAGGTRQTTAVAVAEEVLSLTGEQDVCLVATGSIYADALAASPYAYWSASPIYLTNNDGSISEEVLASIKAAGYSQIIILGGTSSVTEETEAALSEIASVTRLGGSTRYETAEAIAEWSVAQGMSYDGLTIATGTNYPDALTASALCGKNGSVLLLSAATAEDSTVLEEVVTENAESISDVYIVGGYSSVSEEIREMVTNALVY